MQKYVCLSFRNLASWTKKLVIGSLMTCLYCSSVSANAVIEQAEIYKVRNQVDLNRRNKSDWRRAELGDVLIPQDAIRTGVNSRADLLFNEGTLVRTGAGTIFRFPPGKRSFELVSGAALIMIRPEQGESTINTPEAKIVTKGTALFVQHNPDNRSSLIGVLTESPAGLVQVSSADGKVTIELQPGQFVSVVQGVLGLVEYFVLPMFYETVELAAGLGIEQEDSLANESPEARATIQAIRAEAINPLTNQLAWLRGFCQINVDPETLSPLWQWLGLDLPQEQFNLELPETDLFVVPFRSSNGLAWLSNYCQSNLDT